MERWMLGMFLRDHIDIQILRQTIVRDVFMTKEAKYKIRWARQVERLTDNWWTSRIVDYLVWKRKRLLSRAPIRKWLTVANGSKRFKKEGFVIAVFDIRISLLKTRTVLVMSVTYNSIFITLKYSSVKPLVENPPFRVTCSFQRSHGDRFSYGRRIELYLKLWIEIFLKIRIENGHFTNEQQLAEKVRNEDGINFLLPDGEAYRRLLVEARSILQLHSDEAKISLEEGLLSSTWKYCLTPLNFPSSLYWPFSDFFSPLAEASLPEHAAGALRAAVGQANLLVNKKMAKFDELVQKHLVCFSSCRVCCFWVGRLHRSHSHPYYWHVNCIFL